MGTITVANMRHTKRPPISARDDETIADFYIGRPTPLGNPYALASGAGDEQRARVIEQYAQWLDAMLANPSSEQAQHFAKLRARALEMDITLWCWCTPKACHGDIIADRLRKSLGLSEQPEGAA